jgi:radical SAM superfamily enzyme YgiQ (UPF0313 family)
MKIFLVLPESDDTLYSKVFGINFPPVGLAYLSGFLNQKGYKIKIVDMPALNMKSDQFQHLLHSEKPDIVGIYCALTRVNQAINAARISKDEGAFTIFGGPEPSINGKTILLENPCVDAVVRGEGETTFVDLIERVDDGRGLKGVEGITYRDGQKVIANPPRPLIKNLDELPFPAWHLFPIKNYNLFNYFPLLSIASSRGCTFNCGFCAVPEMYQHTWRGRSSENVVDEMEYLVEKYSPSVIFISDDCFMANLTRVEKICDALHKRNLDISWACLSRTDIPLSLMHKMKKSRCIALLFNLESQMINNTEAVKVAFGNAQKAGIIGVANFVFGFPGETYNVCRRNLSFILDLDADHAMFFRNVSNSDLDLGTLNKIEKEAYRAFYLRKSYYLTHVIKNTKLFGLNKVALHFAVRYLKWFIKTLFFVNQLSV